ncbi:HhH-GPD-type base excision DNA repair protein [Spongiactinospora sp. TRM90649]|uniref:HhH-GPD-type base excision DNA repair protein n=1 Tax=Spongiactinospora sp. TRM90649 TaxID=3031114 RepID=UPI0023F7F48D|nr:HhH-GPD-type base excision DNA repair protein [Spongiactinospora sp. TRM90649]MDF5755387.1 HhH-GPD-type base excision DNA repair protein [Spongiactinospora sp. TRM90649]
MRIQLAQRAEADELLGRNPFALLTGMLLDQQVAMEWAFTGPYTIAERLGGDLTPEEIVSRDPEEFAALLAAKPAVHRYPSSMAKRVQQLAAYLVEHYDGDAEALWRDVSEGKEVLRRLNALPGFGKQKAQIFLALLGKQLGVRPEGWREAAGAYGEEGSLRSVADVVDDDTLGKVRAAKQAAKQAAKSG